MLNRIKSLLLKLVYLVRYQKSYSQDGEDLLLLSFIETYPKGYKGFYIDIGAHHPVRFSNTYLFYRRGWKGVNIDALPGSMRLFKWMRSRDTNLEVGVTEKEGSMTFYCFDDPAINTFSEEVALDRNANTKYNIVKKIEVPTSPLAKLLFEHVPKGTKIDFMSIDVEGFDLVVLSTNDWSNFTPTFLLVEDLNINIEELTTSEMHAFVKSKGYELVGKTKRTLLYQHMTS